MSVIVSWNVAGALTNGRHERAAAALRDVLGADVAMLQEAMVEPDAYACVVGRVFDDSPGTGYHWGSFVVSNRTGAVAAVDRVPPGFGGIDKVEDSMPGMSAVARFTVDGRPMFLVSAYGRLTGHPVRHAVSSMHRVLSDVSDLIATGAPVLLAGDFNITTQRYRSGDDLGWWHEQEALVFDRLRALGMVDLIDLHLPVDHVGPIDCPCPLRPCRHVRTTRHRSDPASTPYQNDWAFASPAMASLVTECRVVDDEDLWAISDHAPIRIELR